MKATGIVRKLDPFNRVVIPKEICRTHNLEEGTPMEIFTDTGGKIIIRKYEPGCDFCGANDNILKSFRNHQVCADCVTLIKKL